MDVIFVTITLIVVIAFLFKSYFTNNRISDLVDKIPGPTKIPFFGTLFPFIYTPRHGRFKLLSNFANKYKNLGFFRMWIGSQIPEIRILRCDHAEKIFRSSKNIEKSSTYKLIESWLGQGKMCRKHKKICNKIYI
jgi:hypothetical protein